MELKHWNCYRHHDIPNYGRLFSEVFSVVAVVVLLVFLRAVFQTKEIDLVKMPWNLLSTKGCAYETMKMHKWLPPTTQLNIWWQNSALQQAIWLTWAKWRHEMRKRGQRRQKLWKKRDEAEKNLLCDCSPWFPLSVNQWCPRLKCRSSVSDVIRKLFSGTMFCSILILST